MPRWNLVPLAVLVSPVALAAPVPKVTVTPLTAANAADVRLLKEVEKRAYRIHLGPKAGEVTVIDYARSIEVLDDREFKPVKGDLPALKPMYFTASADGKHRAWVERHTTKYMWENVAIGKKTEIEVGDMGSGAAFSPDGKRLVIGYNVVTVNDPEGGGFSESRVYDTATGKLLHTLEKDRQGGLTPVFSPDGKILAVGNRNHPTRLFDPNTGELLHTLERKMTHEIAFSPDGKKLAAAYVDGVVAVWDVKSGKKLGEAKSGCDELYSVDWGVKGDVLATSGLRGKVVLWDADKLTKLKELEVGLWVIQAKFTADGARLLTASAADHAATRERKISVFGLTGAVAK